MGQKQRDVAASGWRPVRAHVRYIDDCLLIWLLFCFVLGYISIFIFLLTSQACAPTASSCEKKLTDGSSFLAQEARHVMDVLPPACRQAAGTLAQEGVRAAKVTAPDERPPRQRARVAVVPV